MEVGTLVVIECSCVMWVVVAGIPEENKCVLDNVVYKVGIVVIEYFPFDVRTGCIINGVDVGETKLKD